jgi:hypothetical protein
VADGAIVHHTPGCRIARDPIRASGRSGHRRIGAGGATGVRGAPGCRTALNRHCEIR